LRLLDAVAARTRAQWRLKAALSAALTVLFAVPYFTLQRVALFPVRRLELTSLDQAIPFDPRWVWVYQSVYVLIALVPWLATTREQLLRYTRGFVCLSLVSFACFLLFPVAAPRPEILPTTGMFAWLVWYDGSTNTFPSLHVGLATYTLWFGAQTVRGALAAGVRRRLLMVGAIWVTAIAYAAVATKQHYVVDLPAGLITAVVAHGWARRDRRAPAGMASGLSASTVEGPGR
jgi:hypothetical protein